MSDIGRPSDCIPEKTKPILDSISKRVPYKLAAQANGIHESTFYNWMNRGEADLKNGIKSNEASFFESVKNVEQQRVIEHNDCINSMPERWQAQAWILGKRWHEFYSDNAAIVQLNEKLDAMRRELESKTNG
jgi:hypothetical protein